MLARLRVNNARQRICKEVVVVRVNKEQDRYVETFFRPAIDWMVQPLSPRTTAIPNKSSTQQRSPHRFGQRKPQDSRNDAVELTRPCPPHQLEEGVGVERSSFTRRIGTETAA